jgi:hypothetical protein
MGFLRMAKDVEPDSVAGRQRPPLEVMVSRRANSQISGTQLISRFDRNGERRITLALLRQVRRQIRRDMRAAGARGPLAWRLARTPSGLTITAFWHPRLETKVALALAVRMDRRDRRRQAGSAAAINRRRLGWRPFQSGATPAAMEF